MLKPWLKYLVYSFRMAEKAGRLHFYYTRFRNRSSNLSYLKLSPGTVLPPDDDLHDTYRLDYQKFIEDGALAAAEIIEWTKPYLVENPSILDWGCGAGRIIRHLPALRSDALLFGCDTNEERIQWNRENYQHITFTPVHSFTPMPYAPGFFDLVFGISVFTHIDAAMQEEWIGELHRILNENGVLLVTTQGSFYEPKLISRERKQLTAKGIFTKTFHKHGHRMMSTYHKAAAFRKMTDPYFKVLSYYDGSLDTGKMGGQDLWILAKR